MQFDLPFARPGEKQRQSGQDDKRADESGEVRINALQARLGEDGRQRREEGRGQRPEKPRVSVHESAPQARILEANRAPACNKAAPEPVQRLGPRGRKCGPKRAAAPLFPRPARPALNRPGAQNDNTPFHSLKESLP